MKLKHEIQDLIDAGKFVVGNHPTNANHKAFKDPLPIYEQGDSSKTKGGAKANYTYVSQDNIINMIEPSHSEYCNVIIVQDKPNESRYERALTHSQKKVTLQGASFFDPAQATSNPSTLPNKQKESTLDKFKRLTSSSSFGYSVV